MNRNTLLEMLIRRSRGVVPVFPTDYQRRYMLTTDLTDEKNPSNPDYNLTQGSSTNISHGTTQGIARALLSGGCLFSTYSQGVGILNGGAVSVWCKMNSTPTVVSSFKCFVNNASSSSSPFAIGYMNGVYAMAYDETNVKYVSSTKAVDDLWHCLTLNYDKEKMLVQLWCDGVKLVESSLSETLSKGTGITVNAYSASQSNPEGLIDYCMYRNVTFFSRTLTEAEIIGLARELKPTKSIRFAAGVDTTLYLTNANGVFTATPNGDWGGTGYHNGIVGTWVSFYPKHGVKYSLDGGTTYLDWCFEDTNATLDLSSVGTTITGVTKVSGRDTVSLSVQQITVNDPSSSSGIYEFDVEMS